jgi:hypothetical protein
MQTLQIEEQAHCAVLGKAEIGCTAARLNNTVRLISTPPVRIHENRALFVCAQKNAQRRSFDDLLRRSSPTLSDRLRSARQISFPATSDLLKQLMPSDTETGFHRTAGVQRLELNHASEVHGQIEALLCSLPDTEMVLSIGERGGMSFCDEHFVDLALPMFVERISHWAGLWTELLTLGSFSMTVLAQDWRYGLVLEADCPCCSDSTVYLITHWNHP